MDRPSVLLRRIVAVFEQAAELADDRAVLVNLQSRLFENERVGCMQHRIVCGVNHGAGSDVSIDMLGVLELG